MPTPDPVLEELRAIRDAIAKASDDDLQRIADAARARQRQSGRKGVQLSPKRIGSTKKAS